MFDGFITGPACLLTALLGSSEYKLGFQTSSEGGAFKAAGQTLLSAFSSIEGQTIREAELGAVGKCRTGEGWAF